MKTKKLKFRGESIKPDVRMLYDMEEVVYDKQWLEGADNVPLYFMYRDICNSEDEKKINERDLRYDITVIPPQMLGEEYVKTKGHFHPKAKTLTYPELYEVLEGEAHYFLQIGKKKVERTVLIRAKKGDKVIIPPGYGHVTINPSSEELKMANWVCRNFDSIYQPILEKNGAAWFELESGFVRNDNYRKVPELEVFEASENDPFERGIYELIKEPGKLDFLISPEENKEVFKDLEFF
ncbi:MAG: glucose-6-phosphate isomerase family protein [Candidatus Aenigmatarchaeota archaeon]